MMGDAVLRGKEVDSSNVKGVFLADLTAKGWRYFCTHHKKFFVSSKLWVSDGRSLKQNRNVMPVQP
jgi:hypothetical protein